MIDGDPRSKDNPLVPRLALRRGYMISGGQNKAPHQDLVTNGSMDRLLHPHQRISGGWIREDPLPPDPETAGEHRHHQKCGNMVPLFIQEAPQACGMHTPHSMDL